MTAENQVPKAPTAFDDSTASNARLCSTAKTDLVRVGADQVIDYRRDDFSDGRQRYDAVLDIAGNSRLSDVRRALTPWSKPSLIISATRADLRRLLPAGVGAHRSRRLGYCHART
jgi:NADPH:quinone reductase-like Zn-dependent oxidoreductase